MQGFPDYFTFVGLGTTKNSTWVRHNSLTQRYQQLGNAVSPLVADALGRCLATAAVGKAPVGAFVISAPSAELDRVSGCLPSNWDWTLHSAYGSRPAGNAVSL